jgi:hypothetical protein
MQKPRWATGWWRAREVRGRCAMRYQLGGAFAVERFYIKEAGKGVCPTR